MTKEMKNIILNQQKKLVNKMKKLTLFQKIGVAGELAFKDTPKIIKSIVNEYSSQNSDKYEEMKKNSDRAFSRGAKRFHLVRGKEKLTPGRIIEGCVNIGEGYIKRLGYSLATFVDANRGRDETFNEKGWVGEGIDRLYSSNQ